MMSWNKRIAALGLGLLFAAGAFAQQPQTSTQTERRHMRGEHAGPESGFLRHALRRLNLTDAQRQQVGAIVERFRTNTASQREELRQLHEQRQQVGDELTAEQRERARALHEQIRQAGESMNAEILAVLTPEQRAQLDQMREQFRARRQQMRERRQGDMQSPPQP